MRQVILQKEIVSRPEGLKKVNENFEELYSLIENIQVPDGNSTAIEEVKKGLDNLAEMVKSIQPVEVKISIPEDIFDEISKATTIAALKEAVMKAFKQVPEV